MKLEEAEKHIKFLKNILDSSWLEKEFQSIKSYTPSGKDENYIVRFHPLAFLIYQADDHIEICKKDKSRLLTEEILRPAILGESIAFLKHNSVEGLENKIQDLMDNNQYDKTEFEVNIATILVRNGRQVKFIKTRSDEEEKTPDLMIDNQIEVECKKKDAKTKRDRVNEDLSGFIVHKAEDIMDFFGQNYVILIHTQEDLTKVRADDTVTYLRELIKEKREGVFSYTDVHITLKKTFEKDEEVDSGLDDSIRTSLKLDELYKRIQEIASDKTKLIDLPSLLNSEFDYQVLIENSEKDGRTILRNIRIIAIKTAIPSDRLVSVISSIKTAKKQLSGKCPGLICVNLNTISNKMIDNDYQRLTKMIENIFNNNTSISGVLVTREYYTNDGTKTYYSHDGLLYRNKNAKLPLPQDIVDSILA